MCNNISMEPGHDQEVVGKMAELSNQANAMEEGQLLIDILQEQKPGPIARSYFTNEMRNLLTEHGIDPNQTRSSEEISEDVSWFVGEEAVNYFKQEWGIEYSGVEKQISQTLNVESQTRPQSVILQSAEPAIGELKIIEMGYTPTAGSITIHYEGEQVTTTFTTNDTATNVAYAIYGYVNGNPDIQLTAVVPEPGTIRFSEQRPGCEYNGNQISVYFTEPAHISVNTDRVILNGGHDGGGYCQPSDPNPQFPVNPPNPVYLDWGSFIDTNSNTWHVAMGSWTAASKPVSLIGVAGHSYEDGWLVASLYDELPNSNYVIVGVTTWKDPNMPSLQFQQYGEHFWHINPQDLTIWYATSYSWTNF